MSNAQLAEIHAAIDCLGRLSAAFGDRREQLAQSVGLTEHQWGVLEEISTEHFMPSMFARKRDSTPAAVSKTLRQLIDKGLVEVKLNKSDGRQRDYQLTRRGKRTMSELREARAQAIEQIWQKLDRDEVRSFTSFGNKLAQALLEHANNISQQRDDHGKDALRESL
jgi:DNA-binding MarR family transcriptional regulator